MLDVCLALAAISVIVVGGYGEILFLAVVVLAPFLPRRPRPGRGP